LDTFAKNFTNGAYPFIRKKWKLVVQAQGGNAGYAVFAGYTGGLLYKS
jgi:hypothetical protein